MCSSKDKVTTGMNEATPTAVAKINGRPVLQPTCNRVPSKLDHRNSLKKPPPPPPLPLPTFIKPNKPAAPLALMCPAESKSPRPQAIKRGNDLNLSSEKVVTPRSNIGTLERKKSKSFKEGGNVEAESSLMMSTTTSTYSSSLIVDSPGSIAAVRKEQMALQQAQRKMRIAHYGRSKSAKFESKVAPLINLNNQNAARSTPTTCEQQEEKRCSFITANSGTHTHTHTRTFVIHICMYVYFAT